MKKKKKFSFTKIAVFISVLLFGLFVFSSYYNSKLELKRKQAVLENLEEQYNQKVSENNEIKEVYEVLNNLDEENIKNNEKYNEALAYIEKVARKNYNYVKPGERVFVNIAGE